MKLRIPVLPSNQPHNAYAGLPGVTEQSAMLKVAQACVVEINRQGHEGKLFFKAGEGSSNVDELIDMVNAAVAYGKGSPAASFFILSLHSDVEPVPGRKDIFPQIRDEASRQLGEMIGKDLAGRVGFAFQPAAVRGTNLAFFTHTRGLRALLLECGNHSQASGAAFNNTYWEFLGIMAARSVVKMLSGTVKDDKVSCAVPPGQERWKADAPTPPPKPTPPGVPIVIYPQPAGHHILFKGCPFHDDNKILQAFLNAHNCPCGLVDGDFGDKTEAALNLWNYRVECFVAAGHAKFSQPGAKLTNGKCDQWTWGSFQALK